MTAAAMQNTNTATRTAAVVFAGFCAFVTIFAPQPLLPLLAREFRVSAAAISLVVTASTLAVAMAAPFAGVVADRFGRKRVIVPAAGGRSGVDRRDRRRVVISWSGKEHLR